MLETLASISTTITLSMRVLSNPVMNWHAYSVMLILGASLPAAQQQPPVPLLFHLPRF